MISVICGTNAFVYDCGTLLNCSCRATEDMQRALFGTLHDHITQSGTCQRRTSKDTDKQ